MSATTSGSGRGPGSPVGSATTSAGPQRLFDAGRGRHYRKPALRGWSHLIFFQASLVIGTLLIAGARGPLRLTAAAIYVGAVSGMFGISALYHRGNWGGVARRRLQRWDHVMIFVLIAGTATPALLLAAAPAYRLVCLLALWLLALIAALVRVAWVQAPERAVGLTYLGLGWAAGAAVPPVWVNAGTAPALLLVIGGLLYTGGAVAYHRRRPDPAPTVFGYHEVFHAMVCAAATCHYIAVALLVV